MCSSVIEQFEEENMSGDKINNEVKQSGQKPTANLQPAVSTSIGAFQHEPLQTTISESLRVFREAVDTLEENSPRKDPSQELDVVKAMNILADPKVVTAFETFTKFIGCIAEHLRDTTCSHPCFKGVAPQIQEYQGSNTFLGDLGNSSMSFYHELTVAEKTSTPCKDKNMSLETFEENGAQNIDIQTQRHETCSDPTVIQTQSQSVLIPYQSASFDQGFDSSKRQETGIHENHSDPAIIQTQSQSSSIPEHQCTSTSGFDQKSNLSERRMSPRKHSSSALDSSDQIKLLPNSDIWVNRKALKKACMAATKKKDNAGYHLMYNLMDQVFTLHEMSESRGTGAGRAPPGEETKPVLDQQKICVLKQFVNSWCRKNLCMSFPEKSLNSAVTERNSYARKQMKKQRKKALNLD